MEIAKQNWNFVEKLLTETKCKYFLKLRKKCILSKNQTNVSCKNGQRSGTFGT